MGVVSPRDLDRNRKDDYVSAWTASIQQKLPFNLVGTVSYLGNKGTDVLTTTYVNLACQLDSLVPYPAFGAVSWRGDVGNSTFEALQSNLRRTFTNGFLLSVNYMWSHSINDGSIGGGESDTPQDSFCRSCDKASSDDDIRQTFNLSAVYALPFKNRFWGNWELSAIGTCSVRASCQHHGGSFELRGSRTLYNQRRRAAELRLWRVADTSRRFHAERLDQSRPFAVPANGTFGSLGRNAFRAPGISQLDMGVSKFVTITERLSLRFRADLFNVLNRAQFGAPNADISTSNFGTITSTSVITPPAAAHLANCSFQLKIVF